MSPRIDLPWLGQGVHVIYSTVLTRLLAPGPQQISPPANSYSLQAAQSPDPPEHGLIVTIQRDTPHGQHPACPDAVARQRFR